MLPFALAPTPDRMNLRQLEAFRAVMIAGTATEAAALLHTTQPAISYLIRQFERASKLKLFELHRGRLVPTQEAKVLFQEVERNYAGMDRIREAITSLQNSGVGRLSIGTLHSLGMAVMPDAIHAFLQAASGVSISLQATRSGLVRDGVASGLFDLGFAAEEIDANGVDAQPFAAIRAVCVMQPSHPLAGRAAIRASDLTEQAFITVNRTDLTRRRLDQAMAEAGHSVQPAVEASDGAMVCALAARGVGIGLVNPFIAADFSERGLIIKPFEPAIAYSIFLLFPAHTPPSQLAVRFAACVRAELLHRPGVKLHKSAR
jgi:DNA-binding transcriptional LysR family regulator